NKRDTDRNQKERKELAPCEMADQLCIGLTEVFDRDPKNRVEDKEQSSQHSVGLTCPRAHQPQNREQNDSFEKRFVELRWMPRRQDRAQSTRDLWLSMQRGDNRLRGRQRWINLPAGRDCALCFGRMIEQLFWKLHCPGNICNAPVKFAVDEIGAAAKEQTKRRGYDKIVAQVQPRDFGPMGIVKSEKQHPDHPAMARHSAFPYPQDRQRLAQHFRFVEENVPEAATNDDTEKRAAR